MVRCVPHCCKTVDAIQQKRLRHCWDVGRDHVSSCGFCHLATTVAFLACRIATLLYVAVARNRFEILKSDC